MSNGQKPHGAGRSSFEFIDIDRLFQYLSLMTTTVFLDLGCGKGNYALAAARAVGPLGVVYGIDVWQEGLDELEKRAAPDAG